MAGRASREQFGQPDEENKFNHGSQKVGIKESKGSVPANFKGRDSVNNASTNGFGSKWNAPSGGFSNKKRPSGLA